jgi:hypothetical protein
MQDLWLVLYGLSKMIGFYPVPTVQTGNRDGKGFHFALTLSL